MPSPNPNLKVKDEDNIFLKSMELMVIIATKDNNTKVIPLVYRSRCLIYKKEFDPIPTWIKSAFYALFSFDSLIMPEYNNI
jgi:hypothetical protein